MITINNDAQVVGEVLSTMFTFGLNGPVSATVFLKNDGVNTINYDFQQNTGTGWSDIGISGSVYNNTLQPGAVLSLVVVSAYPQVQLLANASGGSYISFSVTRYFSRTSGGPI